MTAIFSSPVGVLSSGCATTLRWPTMSQMLAVTNAKRTNIGRQLRLSVELLATRPFRSRLDCTVRDLPHWRALFESQDRSFEPLVQTFMDCRLSVAQRFDSVQFALHKATDVFGPPLCAQLAQGNSIRIWHLPNQGAVELSANVLTMQEGMWSLGLLTAEGVRVSHVSFSFMPSNQLMIGTVQGPGLANAEAVQGIRELTRAAEGLRPPYLLIEILRAWCRQWALALAGVDPMNHAKKKWHQKELLVDFDYRGFWTDLGGNRSRDGNWNIPIFRPVRDLATVPTKRRAMYRRRTELLLSLERHCRMQAAAATA